MTTEARTKLLELLLTARIIYAECFELSNNVDVMAAFLEAAHYVDECIDLLADSAPHLADEVAMRRPLINVPDCVPEGVA